MSVNYLIQKEKIKIADIIPLSNSENFLKDIENDISEFNKYKESKSSSIKQYCNK